MNAEAQAVKIPGLPEQWGSLRADFLAYALLAVVAIALYLPMLRADFVYDARPTVYGNDYIHHPGNLADVVTLRIMHMDVMDNNRPVYVANAMIDWAIWGENPAGHHFENALFHACVVLLLFRLCRKLRGDDCVWIPFCAALLYAVHPLNCEAVAEVSYRKDLLAAIFVLAGLNLATAFEPVRTRKNILMGAACVACMFLAVGAKENGIAGPPLLVCYWLLFRRGESRNGWIALCAAAALVVGLFLVARFTLLPKESIIFVQKPRYPGGTFWGTMMFQPRIWVCYFRNVIWPRGLSADYGPYSIRNFDFALCVVTLLLIVAAQGVLAIYNRMFAMGVFLFWFAMLPVSNFVPIYRPMADRFLYFPMAGVAVMLASVPWRKVSVCKSSMAVALLAACLLAAVTLQREKVWHNSLTLWEDSSRRNPVSVDSLIGFGGALRENGSYQEALAVLQRASIFSREKNADVFASMALAFEALGRKAEADAAFKKAVELDGRYADPDAMVRAMTWEQPEASQLKVVALRNK